MLLAYKGKVHPSESTNSASSLLPACLQQRNVNQMVISHSTLLCKGKDLLGSCLFANPYNYPSHSL